MIHHLYTETVYSGHIAHLHCIPPLYTVRHICILQWSHCTSTLYTPPLYTVRHICTLQWSHCTSTLYTASVYTATVHCTPNVFFVEPQCLGSHEDNCVWHNRAYTALCQLHLPNWTIKTTILHINCVSILLRKGKWRYQAKIIGFKIIPKTTTTTKTTSLT